MRKALVIGLGAALLAAGCGDDSDDANDETTTTTEAAKTTTAEESSTTTAETTTTTEAPPEPASPEQVAAIYEYVESNNVVDDAGVEVISADSPMVSDNLVPVTDAGDAKAILRIMEALDTAGVSESTLVLFITATISAYYLGFVVGKILAWRRGGFTEYSTTLVGVGLYTVFLPWFALMMVWFFAFTLGWFPIGKFLDPVIWRSAPVDANFVFHRMLVSVMITSLFIFTSFYFARRLNPNQRRITRALGVAIGLGGLLLYWISTGVGRYALDIAHHLILPILTLTLVNFAGIMLLTRNSMLETVREDYITTARAKGLKDIVIRDKHASRNAMLPVATSFILALAFVLDGGVITETIFSWPGMGLTLLTAAQVNDIPMVIGALVFTGFLALTAHLIADIYYAFLDPRIRYT